MTQLPTPSTRLKTSRQGHLQASTIRSSLHALSTINTSSSTVNTQHLLEGNMHCLLGGLNGSGETTPAQATMPQIRGVFMLLKNYRELHILWHKNNLISELHHKLLVFPGMLIHIFTP